MTERTLCRARAGGHPGRVGLAHFTYLPSWTRMVYVAFVFDVFSPRNIGWLAASRMTTPLMLDQAFHGRCIRFLHGPRRA